MGVRITFTVSWDEAFVMIGDSTKGTLESGKYVGLAIFDKAMGSVDLFQDSHATETISRFHPGHSSDFLHIVSP